MTSLTFKLEDNNLVVIDPETEIPHTIPLSVDGLKQVYKLLKENDDKLISSFLYMRQKEQAAMKEIHSYRAQKELEELF